MLALSLGEDAAALAPALIPRAYRAAVGSTDGASATPESERPATPPPPLRGGPLSGQRPTPPSLPRDAPPEAVAQRLALLTKGALARQELMQIASLPKAAAGQSWMFEIPFVTPQGTAMAQLQVREDEGEANKRTGSRTPVWTARLSLDLPPIGPVHAEIRLKGTQASVGLWAERPESAATLRQDRAELLAALKASGLTAEVAVQQGSPGTPAPAPGRFLDQAS